MPEESVEQRLIRERKERLNRHEERIRREERDRERTARENKRAEGAGTMERHSISEGVSTLHGASRSSTDLNLSKSSVIISSNSDTRAPDFKASL